MKITDPDFRSDAQLSDDAAVAFYWAHKRDVDYWGLRNVLDDRNDRLVYYRGRRLADLALTDARGL